MRKRSECTRHVLELALLAFFCLRVGAIKTHNFEEYCDYSVSRDDPVGILRFNTSRFFDHHGNSRECKVKVSPEQVPGSRGFGDVLFYFTQFELPGSCSDLTLLLLDGSSTYDPHVVGAPSPLCGHNVTLTSPGLVFYTTTSLFSVVINWTEPATTWRSGGFILKFSAFYDGPCENSDEVITCNNTRCTSKAYHCHADIDTCGLDEEETCAMIEKELLDNALKWLKVIVKHIAIFVAVCIGLWTLWQLFKLIKKRHLHGSLSNCFRKCRWNRRPSRRRPPIRRPYELPPPPQDTYHPLTPRRDFDILTTDMTPTSPARSGSVSSLDSVINDTGASDPEPQAQPGLAAPPPSYDSLGPHTVTLPPSYIEFVSNEHRFNDTSI